ncbi:MAG: YggS family pyridoxal phosphate-dependent enzyme [Burkholderiaceae bacterium]|nr:YggS family pyridoxal phosphate-dependent enzyme [Burkholderiaceae bacterium]
MSLISNNLQVVRADLIAAANAAGRLPEEIGLMAVSKTFDEHAVLEAAASGQRVFGENYVQEAVDKINRTRLLAPDLHLDWHFIGPIQSNKTKLIAENFAWVHSVDREKIAQRLSEQRPADAEPLNVCIQVNISKEESKSGVMPEDCLRLAEFIVQLPRLALRGLMAVPRASDDVAEQRSAFRQLRELRDNVQDALGERAKLDTLSMGMSGDMHAAIAEGSTIVRIGSNIFGKRTYAAA